MRSVDIAIAGAGPAGLTTALALRKTHPNLVIHNFERAKRMAPAGGSIGLSTENVYAALRAIGPEVEQAIIDASIQRRDFIKADMHYNVYDTLRIKSNIISWFDMQQALYGLLPEDSVSLGSGVTKVKDEAEGAIITLADGSRVRCKLLVGADGNRSQCRAHIQPGTEPEYTGAVVWRFFMPASNPFVAVGDTLVMTGEGKTFVLQPVKRNGTVCTYVSGIAGWPDDQLEQLNQTRYVQAAEEDSQAFTAKLDRFGAAFRSFHAPIVDFVLANAVPESVLEHPMYALQPRMNWHAGRVVLVGDAAHVMPPNLSQGTPQAFEDAVQLAASLKAHGLTDAALAEYERVRKERVLPIWDASTHQAVQFYRHRDEGSDPFKQSVSATVFQDIMAYTAPSLA